MSGRRETAGVERQRRSVPTRASEELERTPPRAFRMAAEIRMTADAADVDRDDHDLEGGGVEQGLASSTTDADLDQTQYVGDHADFKMTKVDGVDFFECTTCGKAYKGLSSVKSHITKMHKKSKEQEKTITAAKDDAGQFDLARLDRWQGDLDGQKTSTQRPGGIGDDTLADLFSSQEVSLEVRREEQEPEQELEPETMEEQVERLTKELKEAKDYKTTHEKELEDMVANAKDDQAKIDSLNEALKNNQQLLDIIKGTNGSLEIEIEKKNEIIKKFEISFNFMEAKVGKLEDAVKKNYDPNAKAMKDELKAKKKEIDDANKKANEAMKKLKDETNAKAMAQSEVIRLTKLNEIQIKIIEKMEKPEERRGGEKRRRSRSEDRREVRRRDSNERNERREKSMERRGRSKEKKSKRKASKERKDGSKSKEQCWDFKRTGRCNYGSQCKYSHGKEGESGSSNESIRERRRRKSPSQERGRRSSSKERQGRRSSSRDLCRDIDRPGGCTWYPKCKYFHPEENQEECSYWLQDSCTFGEKCRNGLHDPTRRGIKRRISRPETRQEPRLEQRREPRLEQRQEPRMEQRREPRLDQIQEPRMEQRREPRVDQRHEPWQEQRQEPRLDQRQEPRQELRRSSTDGPDFLKSLVSLVSQGITKGSEAHLPNYGSRVASPVRGGQHQQDLAEGTFVMLQRGQKVVWDSEARASQERPSFRRQ